MSVLIKSIINRVMLEAVSDQISDPGSATNLKQLISNEIATCGVQGADIVAEWIDDIDEADAAFTPFYERYETIREIIENEDEDEDYYVSLHFAEGLGMIIDDLAKYWNNSNNFGPGQQLKKIDFNDIAGRVYDKYEPPGEMPSRSTKKMSKSKDADTKVYPDSREGVIAMLTDLFGLKSSKMSPIKTRPDPEVDGVWEVICDPELNDGVKRHIAYLAGYKDPFGKIRDQNDAEQEYDDEM